MIDSNNTRQENLTKVEKIYLPININLPFIETYYTPHSKDDIISRSLCTYALLAVSFGFDINLCKKWLKQENLISALTPTERLILEQNKGLEAYSIKVEALWALAWSMNLIEKLDYSEYCGDNLSSLFPKISKNESTEFFRSRITLRSYDVIWNEADLIYCIHWGMKENILHNKENSLPLYVIEERRRSLDWILFEDDWENIPLDT